jgi:translation elongation factor P/translation initiation factor 5A
MEFKHQSHCRIGEFACFDGYYYKILKISNRRSRSGTKTKFVTKNIISHREFIRVIEPDEIISAFKPNYEDHEVISFDDKNNSVLLLDNHGNTLDVSFDITKYETNIVNISNILNKTINFNIDTTIVAKTMILPYDGIRPSSYHIVNVYEVNE